MAALRREEREYRRKGEEILDQFFSKNEIAKSTTNIDKLCRYHNAQKPAMLYADIGSGKIQLDANDLGILQEKTSNSGGWKRLFFFGRKNKKQQHTAPANPAVTLSSDFKRGKALLLNEYNIQHNYTLSECCQPIPGDPVMGYLDDTNSIVIHKLTCPVAERLKVKHGNRVLVAEWDKMQNRTLLFPVNIALEGLDKLGLLNQITRVISQEMNVNMHKLNVECNDGIFECKIQLFVHDTTELDELIKKLQAINDVKSVARL